MLLILECRRIHLGKLQKHSRAAGDKGDACCRQCSGEVALSSSRQEDSVRISKQQTELELSVFDICRVGFLLLCLSLSCYNPLPLFFCTESIYSVLLYVGSL